MFLKDYFVDQKARSPLFTYRAFATKAGFNSSGFCHLVIEGQRNLTQNSLEKMLQGLGFHAKQRKYFELLVAFNQAKSSRERQKALEEMQILQKGSASFRLQHKHKRYCEFWWIPVLRHLAIHAPWGDDYSLLARLVDPPITTAQAQEGITLLQDLGLLHRTQTGHWEQKHSFTDSSDISGYHKVLSRKQFFQLGLESLDRYPSSERHATYFTLSLGMKNYQRAIEWISELNLKLANLASTEQSVDRIYELTTLLFPLSQRWKK